MNPKISIVIPIKNAAIWLDKLIENLFSQSLAKSSEIIFIDSGSEDDSVKIIKRFPQIKLIRIEPYLFNHGTTRNLGVAESKGEFVVFTVQDALPVNNLWLQNLLYGFIDNKVSAVCGKQIVEHDQNKNPVAWHRPLNAPAMKIYQFENVCDFNILSPEKKREICSWDNVNAMYRRSILLKIPFSNTVFAEDTLWAKNALEAGLAIAYNDNALVSHYHNENFNFSYRRTLIEVFYMFKIFGQIPDIKRYNVKHYLKIIMLLLLDTKIKPTRKLKWLKYNFKQTAAIKKAISYFIKKLKQGGTGMMQLEKEITLDIPQGNKQSNLIIKDETFG